MSGHDSVSAFAARRAIAPTDTLSVAEQVPPRHFSPELLEEPSSFEVDELSSPSASEDGNQFAVPNRTITAPSSGSKRIFELDDNAIRVELSNDQSIAVLGICNIWVKTGEIAVLGARLRASPLLQRIYAPTTLALPQITACSEHADFVLTSTGDDLLDLYASTKRPIWEVPEQKNSTERSFHILGYSFTYDETLRKRLRVFDLSKWRSIMATVSKPVPEGRTVLVCGSGSTGKSTLCRASINRLLADQTFPQDTSQPQPGVLLIDLDLIQPELTPPGLVYLAHVRKALLGPPESHLTTAESGQNCILRMHYLGGVHADYVYDAGTNAVQDLVQYCKTVRTDFPGCAVLINSSSWLLEMEPAQLSSLISMMQLSDIVYFDSSGSLRYQDVLTRSMGDKCKLWGLASKVYRTAPASTIQWSYMQSYFHQISPKAVEPMWDELALLSSNKKELPYSGPKSIIWAVFTPGERLGVENVAQALEDSMVAIVAIENETTWRTESDSPSVELTKSLPSHFAPYIPEMHGERREEASQMMRTEVENLPYFQDLDMVVNLLHPQRSQCLGLAYVTAIDSVGEMMEILTPISHQALSTRRDNGSRLAIVMGRQDRRWAPAHG